MATIKKAQKGIVAKKAAPSKPVAKKTMPGPYSDERVKALDAASVYGKGKKPAPGYKKGGTVPKAQNGKGFPDLNKDGKITKADILKGRGVIAKKGAKVPCASCGKTMKKK